MRMPSLECRLDRHTGQHAKVFESSAVILPRAPAIAGAHELTVECTGKNPAWLQWVDRHRPKCTEEFHAALESCPAFAHVDGAIQRAFFTKRGSPGCGI